MAIHSKPRSSFVRCVLLLLLLLLFLAATLRYRGISVAFFFPLRLFFVLSHDIYLFFDNDANTNVRWSTLLVSFFRTQQQQQQQQRQQQQQNRKLI